MTVKTDNEILVDEIVNATGISPFLAKRKIDKAADVHEFCEDCGEKISVRDILHYRAENGFGCPAVCTDCGENEVYISRKSIK